MSAGAMKSAPTVACFNMSASVEKTGSLGERKGKLIHAGDRLMSEPVKRLASVKQLEIAAGARINQHVYDDPNDLDFWQKEPEGLIVINYCTQAEAEEIIKAGKVDLSGNKEGFLQNVPVGNP